MAKHDSNSFLSSGIQKVLSTIGVQAGIVLLSFVTGLILPAKMGPEMYGYWQVYTLYYAYLNLFGLGYSDGMALFYGGMKYEELPFSRIRGATRLGAVFLCILSAVLFLATGFIRGGEQRFIFRMLVVNIIPVCVTCITITISSAVNRTKLYNGLNLWQRVVTIAAYVLMIALVLTDHQSMILADTITRWGFAIVCVFIVRKMFIGSHEGVREGLVEFREKSSAGMNITLAAIAANIMPIAGKFVIQFVAPMSVFGEYSFGISLINIVATFTSAAGLVIFPMLKRLKKHEMADYFQMLSLVCGCLLFAAMFVYMPCKFLIQRYMTEYAAVLDYLHVLLIICVPLGRLQLLLLSYFKALRLERTYFVGNVIGVVVMLGATWCAYAVTKQVYAVALAASLVYTLWSMVLETRLVRKLGRQTHYWRGQIMNFCMMTAFVACASVDSLIGFVGCYAVAYGLYLLIRSKELKAALKVLASQK